MNASRTMTVIVIRADGSPAESVCVLKTMAIVDIRGIIGCDALDTVNLRDGRVMIVDDLGAKKGKPVNDEATRLYHSVCRPGTTWQICGDVVIANDADFE